MSRTPLSMGAMSRLELLTIAIAYALCVYGAYVGVTQ
jgi:hypothetical protein